MWNELLTFKTQKSQKPQLLLVGCQNAAQVLPRLFPTLTDDAVQEDKVPFMVASFYNENFAIFLAENTSYIPTLASTHFDHILFFFRTSEGASCRAFLEQVSGHVASSSSQVSIVVVRDDQISHQDLDYLMQFIRSAVLMTRPAVMMLDVTTPEQVDFLALVKTQTEIVIKIDFQYVPPNCDTQSYIQLIDETFDPKAPFRFEGKSVAAQSKPSNFIPSSTYQQFLGKLTSSSGGGGSVSPSTQMFSATSAAPTPAVPNNQVLQSFFSSLLKKGGSGADSRSTAPPTGRSDVEHELNKLKNGQP